MGKDTFKYPQDAFCPRPPGIRAVVSHLAIPSCLDLGRLPRVGKQRLRFRQVQSADKLGPLCSKNAVHFAFFNSWRRSSNPTGQRQPEPIAGRGQRGDQTPVHVAGTQLLLRKNGRNGGTSPGGWRDPARREGDGSPGGGCTGLYKIQCVLMRATLVKPRKWAKERAGIRWSAVSCD